MDARPDRRLAPLFFEECAAPAKASMLTLDQVDPLIARQLIAAWHSRLPRTQRGPWRRAYAASWQSTAFAVALWHNPSARGLPGEWWELRRMAVAPDAPHCTASWFLGAMRRAIGREHPGVTLISYQDAEVHTGTIYAAAGWTREHYQAPRTRDRSGARPGGRMYRTNLNGQAPDSAGKYRWQVVA